jgi:CheY-like chemotaxis protein
MTFKSILLVDEDEMEIASFQRALKKLGLPRDILVAARAGEALSWLSREELDLPDFILLDMGVQEVDGYEFLLNLREQERLADVPVFIMTTSPAAADDRRLDTCRIAGAFIKPLSYNNNSRKNDSMDAFVQFYLRKILLDMKTG